MLFSLDDVIEFYEKDPNIARLRQLYLEIIKMQTNSDFRDAESVITRGERLLRKPPNVNPELMNDLNFEKLKKQHGEMIKSKAVNPPITEGFYVEWREGTLRLVLPFLYEQQLRGLSLWYSAANRRVIPWHSNDHYRWYTCLEIPNVPNLTVADRIILPRMRNPTEFDMLNIRLHPVLIKPYPPANDDYPLDEIEYLEEKYKHVQPSKRRRLVAVWECVSQNYDEKGEGIMPKDVCEKVRGNGLYIPKTKIATLMTELAKNGDLRTTGVPATHTVRYWPSYAVMLES